MEISYRPRVPDDERCRLSIASKELLFDFFQPRRELVLSEHLWKVPLVLLIRLERSILNVNRVRSRDDLVYFLGIIGVLRGIVSELFAETQKHT